MPAVPIPFTKMQGLGNDYVYINCFTQRIDNPGALARRISDRHFGVGSDGLVLIMPSTTADLRMRMFNADGTEAEMCGNAIRCVCKYAYDHELVNQGELTVETKAGPKAVRLVFSGNKVTGATVDMGAPELEPAKIPLALGQGSKPCIGYPLEAGWQTYAVTAVSMGNPHAVVFFNDVDSLDLPALGPLFENHPLFPNRVNTEFVEVISREKLKMRVWERGTGETLACGTGACAAAVAAALNGHAGRRVDVQLKGGILHINWDEEVNHVFMTGPAAYVFEGNYLRRGLAYTLN